MNITPIKRRLRTTAAVGLLAVAAATTTACGSNDNGAAAAGPGAVPVDVGGGKVLHLPHKKRLKLALFVEVANNSAVQSTITGVKEKAKELGDTVDVFDPKFDAATQVSQMQSALLRKYDGWIVAAVNGEQVCDSVSGQAPAKSIPVAVVVEPVCGRSSAEGAGLWAPGTLDYIGGNETPGAFETVMEHAAQDNPGHVKVGVLTGPEGHPVTLAYDKALKDFKGKHPDFDVVSELRTDYSPPDSQKKAETMLQAHPDIGVILCVYSTMSKGVVAALQSAGRKPGDVKIYENGGTAWSVQQLQSKWVASTTGYYRRTSGAAAVQALADAYAGRNVPRVVLNDGHRLVQGQRAGAVGVLTAANLSGYRAESP
jgi:ribose transport system substrate-binding protein